MRQKASAYHQQGVDSLRGLRLWTIDLTPEAEKDWKSPELTDNDRIVINQWAQTVRKYGPDELQRHSGQWRDHPLFGHWAGCRASSFSSSGRVIYYRFDKHGIVQVMRITNDHNYTPPH